MRKQTTPLSESQIQHDCLVWFRLQYPKLARMLFAVPNGGKRDAKTGARMKYEGAVRGVADLILLIPKYVICHSLQEFINEVNSYLQ